MGIRAVMTHGNKRTSIVTTVAPGAATYPIADQVGIVTFMDTPDLHRLNEIRSAIIYCMEYARDNNIFNSAVSTTVTTSLNTGKDGIIEEPNIAVLGLNDIGIIIVGSERTKDFTNIAYNSYNQLIDHLREDGRLAA